MWRFLKRELLKQVFDVQKTESMGRYFSDPCRHGFKGIFQSKFAQRQLPKLLDEQFYFLCWNIFPTTPEGRLKTDVICKKLYFVAHKKLYETLNRSFVGSFTRILFNENFRETTNCTNIMHFCIHLPFLFSFWGWCVQHNSIQLKIFW